MTPHDALTGLVFDSVSDDGALELLPIRIAEATGTAVINLLEQGPVGSTTLALHNIPSSLIELYSEHYWRIDPWTKAYDAAGLDVVSVSSAFISDEAMLRTEMYNDLLRPNGDMLRCVGFAAEVGGGKRIVFSAQRGRRHPDFEPEAVALVQHLRPLLVHLSQARRRLMQGRARLAERALDAQTDAVMIVARDGRIVFANQAAASMLTEGRPLHRQAGRLAATDVAFERRFARAMALARSGRGGTVLTCPEIDEAFRISLDALVGAGEGLVCVRVRDMKASALAALDAAAEAYGLSSAEKALAATLLGGQSIADHAELRGVTMNTVRSQIRNLFAKAGVTRQAELVLALRSHGP